MSEAHLLSTHLPNDPDPRFFEEIEAWVEALWDLGIEVHFMEEKDLGPYARQWRWMTLAGQSLRLVVCDDLTIGAREIILSGDEDAFEVALPRLQERLSLESYESALSRARAESDTPVALFRACVASPRPPDAELEALVVAALNSSDSELRYRAVSAAVTLQAPSMEQALEQRLGIERDPRVIEHLRRGLVSFGA